MAALCEEMFRLGFLKISAADFAAGNLRCDGEDGDTAAVRVIQPVDQMEISGTTTSSADGQSSCQMRFRAGGKRRRLFMPHMNPSNSPLSANRVGDSVERVTCDSVNSLDSRSGESVHNQVRNFFLRHGAIHPLFFSPCMAQPTTCRFLIIPSALLSNSDHALLPLRLFFGGRKEQDGQAPRALRAMDDYTLDVGGRRRSGQEDAVGAAGEIDPL